VLSPPDPELLERLARLADESGVAGVAGEARHLAQRVAEGRFHVACVGQFKRGKSTLLNALVGRAVLPVGVVPVTSAITLLRWGDAESARVVKSDGSVEAIALGDLAAFVAEEHNPENEKGVAAVEVGLPSPLLASGMCLVDTPGLGSVFAGNTEVTRRFVPHVDAALVVLGGDPPISGEELDLVAAVTKETPELVFVVNKADRLGDDDLRAARAFAARVLEKRLGRPPGLLFEVSALERLATGAATRDWAALVDALAGLAVRAGADLVRRARVRGVSRLGERLLFDLAEQRDALVRPREESEVRLVHLRAVVADAERSLRDVGALLEAEQRVLARRFDEERDRFLATAVAAARNDLEAAVAASEEPPAALRDLAFTTAQDLARARIDAWLRDVEPRAEALYRQATERFARLTNDLLVRLASSGEPALGALPRGLPPDTGLRERRRFQFHELLALTRAGAGAWLTSHLATRRAAVAAATAEAQGYLEHLLETNSARVANDLTERTLESRRRLEAEVRGQLRGLCTTTERALSQAEAVRERGAGAIEGELARLGELRAEVQAVRRAGAGDGTSGE
jgi:hypothetical protein